MAHIRVTVCLPPDVRGDLEAAIGEALAPFEMYGEFVDRGMWDRWTIRGGSDGSGFSAGPGFEDDPRLIHDAPLHTGEPQPSLPGMCAGGPRGLLDFDGPRATAVSLAHATWDLWHRLAPEYPPVRPHSAFHRRHLADPEAYPGQQAHDDYRAQPLMGAFEVLSIQGVPEQFRNALIVDDPETVFAGDRAEFVQSVSYRAKSFHDLLTLDGWWIEDRDRPVHGACDPALCPHKEQGAQYAADIDGYIEGLPAEAFLVRLKCHG